MNLPDNCEYLGDGLYVSYRGYDYMVFSSDGIQVLNQVFLDSRMIDELVRYRDERRSKNES